MGCASLGLVHTTTVPLKISGDLCHYLTSVGTSGAAVVDCHVAVCPYDGTTPGGISMAISGNCPPGTYVGEVAWRTQSMYNQKSIIMDMIIFTNQTNACQMIFRKENFVSLLDGEDTCNTDFFFI